MSKALPRWVVCVFFAAFLALGLVTAGDYGPTWDEPTEMDILRMNLWEYARTLGLDESRFEALAAIDDPLNSDPLCPISQSIERDHGAALFYPLAGVVMDPALSEGNRSLLWHMGCWCIFTLGALALYGALRRLGLSRGWSLLGPLFLLLSPLFFAHGHFNNKDISLMAMTLCTLWSALTLAERPNIARGLIFSLCGAFAANTKIAGLAVWGLCALYVLVRLLVEKRLTLRVLGLAVMVIVSFLCFYALLTPALWAGPLAFLEYLIFNTFSFQRWNGYILFRGAIFYTPTQPLPWYYLPYMLFATTPLWVLLLCAVGTLVALCSAVRHLRATPGPGLALLLVVLLWMLPLGAAVITHTHVYNGWRHFYFVYGPLLILAVWGMHALWRHTRQKRLLAVLVGLCMLWSGVGLVTQHPYQYVYYQPLVQLKGAGYNELDYWNVSARNALLQLAETCDGPLLIEPADMWSNHALQKSLVTLPEEVQARFVCLPEGGGARFVLSNPTYACFSGFSPEADMTECVTLSAYGQPIMALYERTAKEADRP